MNAKPLAKPVRDSDGPPDPRHDPQFRAEYFPTANGRAAPVPGARDPNDRITLEFLAAYYHLNCAYARLLQVRQQPPSPARTQAERVCLQAIEQHLIARDRLEDQYAARGVLTDPVAETGFTRNLKISFGSADAAGRRRQDFYTLTAYLPIPLPPGMRMNGIPIKIEGPGFNGDY